jgi:hypothetical protein
MFKQTNKYVIQVKKDVKYSKIQNLTLSDVIPVVCIRLMGRELQSITQLNVSNRWYVLDQQKLHVSANRGHRQFCPVEL